jgi:hypothetical protein
VGSNSTGEVMKKLIEWFLALKLVKKLLGRGDQS